MLRALAAFHARGFVHRDVRWPNILRDLSDGGSLLADFELAAPAGASLPDRYRGGDAFPPEARGGGAYDAAGDVWQVGRLIQAWANPPGSAPRVLSPAGAAFASKLAAETSALRPTAAEAARVEMWLKEGLSPRVPRAVPVALSST